MALCECGCGDMPKVKGSRFLPGHQWVNPIIREKYLKKLRGRIVTWGRAISVANKGNHPCTWGDKISKALMGRKITWADKMSQSAIARQENPKLRADFLAMCRDPIRRRHVSEGQIKSYKEGRKVPPSAGRGKGGFRQDLGHYVRSKFEANYCRFLKNIGVDYQYEPKVFVLTLKDGSVTTYQPDLYFPKLNLWRELKGWMSPIATLKLRLFQEQCPNEQIDIIMQSEGNWPKLCEVLKKEILNWEN